MDKATAYLSAKEVAVKLGLEVDTFRKLVAKGSLPQAHTISAKLKMWAAEDVAAMEWYLRNEHRFRKSTADEEERDAE